MRVIRMLSAAALVGGLLLSGGVATAATPAEATTPTAVAAPEVGRLAPIAIVHHRDSDTATVWGRYKCSGPSEQMHLWVSVKQGGPDPTAEGSSSTVDAWYDTNISQDVQVTCNGKWRTASVDLGKHDTDFTGRPLTQLRNGKAWLQFCLVAPGDDPTDPQGGIVASESRWVTVVGAHKH